MRLKVGERPHLWMFSFGSARNCRSKSFPTSPKGRRGPGPCAGTHTVRPPSVRMRPDAARCGHRALRGACFSLSLCRGGACPRPPVPGLRCAAGVIPRPARAIESLWRKNAPSSVTASPCHLPPGGGEGFSGGWRPPLHDIFGLCAGARNARPPVSHQPPLLCQSRRAPRVFPKTCKGR